MPLVYTQENDVAVPTANAAETVIATVNNVTCQRANQPVAIQITGEITTGATVTALVYRCRRGTTVAGVQVGNTITVAAAAATAEPISAGWVDTPGELANGSYVVTVAQTGGTGAGSVNQTATEVTIGNP